MGIEPTSSAWEAEVLPLNYTRQIDGLSSIGNGLEFNALGGCLEAPSALFYLHVFAANAFLFRIDKPLWTFAPACPGLLWVVGVTVFGFTNSF